MFRHPACHTVGETFVKAIYEQKFHSITLTKKMIWRQEKFMHVGSQESWRPTRISLVKTPLSVVRPSREKSYQAIHRAEMDTGVSVDTGWPASYHHR